MRRHVHREEPFRRGRRHDVERHTGGLRSSSQIGRRMERPESRRKRSIELAGDPSAGVARTGSLEPGERKVVGTGWSIELPPDTEAQVRPRSGLALRHGITVLNTPGTIDHGYRGEVGVILINHGAIRFDVHPGMKIAQMVIAPVVTVAVEEASELSRTSRGQGGFGSTGA